MPNTVIPPAHILPNRLLAIQLNFQLVALLKRLLTLVTLADAAQSAAGRLPTFQLLKFTSGERLLCAQERTVTYWGKW